MKWRFFRPSTDTMHDRFAVRLPSAEKTISCVCGCRWRTLWTQDVTFIIYDILCRHFKTQLFEILLFCSVNTGCFVEYNACYVLHFVTAIILRHTKDIYEICNTTSPESKFPNEYSDVIFIQIDQRLKKLLQKYKGVPILWITVYTYLQRR